MSSSSTRVPPSRPPPRIGFDAPPAAYTPPEASCAAPRPPAPRPPAPPIVPPPIVPPPIVSPPAPPLLSVRALQTLPKGLRNLGNSKAWNKVHDHLRDRSSRSKPLVVWGPTGCGKTCGIRELLLEMRYRLVELDGSDPETTEQLLTWVKRMRDMQSMKGTTAILLDDFESFSHEARRRLADVLKKSAPTDAPLLITCTQFKDPVMKPIQGFANVRLFKPNEHICEEWFSQSGFPSPRWNPAAQTWSTVHRFPPPGWTRTEKQHILTGDLRRIQTSLIWKVVTKGGSLAATPTLTPANAFQATQQLLLRKHAPDVWSRHAEMRDMDLIREHIPGHVKGNVDALASMFDYLSVSDCLTNPGRFETRSSQLPLALHLTASATSHFSKAQDVGALYPSACPPASSRPTPSLSDDGRPRTRMELLELPTPLRDLS